MAEPISYKHAKERALPRFFTGVQCKEGHTVERYTANRRCCECQRLAVVKTRVANPDRKLELGRIHGKKSYAKHRDRRLIEGAQFRRENPELLKKRRKINYERHKKKRIAYNMEYMRKNPDKCREWRLRWVAANPETKNASRRRYQARKLGAVPAWADQEAIKDFYRVAVQLSEETGIPHHVDHIIPLNGKYVCGLHVEHNLQVITWVDNLSKANKHIEIVSGEPFKRLLG